MTPLMMFAGGGKEDHAERKKKGRRMWKGAERWRGLQPGVTGWDWEGRMEWPPPLLCVYKSMRATGEGTNYMHTSSLAA